MTTNVVLIGYALVSLWIGIGIILFQFTTHNRGIDISWIRAIPRWTFFAPNPPEESVFVVVRYFQGNAWRAWSLLRSAKSDRRYEWGWNPNGRIRHAVVDAGNHLRNSFASPEVPLHLTVPYISLLALAEAEAPVDATLLQFALISVGGDLSVPEFRVLLVSDQHQWGGA